MNSFSALQRSVFLSGWGGDGSGGGDDGGDVFFSATTIMLYSQTCV